MITNDPENERFELKISGHVEKFVTIDPQRVFLTGSVGEKIEKTVKIIPETKPFKILKVIAMKGSFFTHELKEIEVDGKPAYELTIANTRQEAGRYFDQVTVLTDIGDQAPLSIVVSGDIKEKEKDAQ